MRGFEGWYYKHQKGGRVLALIPGRAQSGAFVQMMTDAGSRTFDVPSLSVRGDTVRAGNCAFSPRGCFVDLPGVQGEIAYGGLSPLRGDIMGPFRFAPGMECRHGVISMAHTLAGSVRVDGETLDFDGGTGYIEKDSGTSFPRRFCCGCSATTLRRPARRWSPWRRSRCTARGLRAASAR